MSEDRKQSRLERRIERARSRASDLQAELDTRYPGAFKVLQIKNRVIIRRLTRPK